MNDRSAPSDMPRISSGVSGLDTVLGGGFIRGGIYIIQGPPGSGKTILTNQVGFHHAATGGKALFVTLMAENHARMIANIRQLAFFDEAVIPDKLAYLSAFTDMRDGGLDALSTMLRREIQGRGATVLVIDGLVSAQASAVSEEAFRAFVHDLQEVAYGTDCTMFLTTNSSTENSPDQTMVDGLIEMSDRIYGWQAQSDLRVRKLRGSGFLRGRHAYKITQAGVVVHPRIEALYAYPSLEPVAPPLGRASTGIAHLDAMLGGGLPLASTTMVMGASGVGKTTLGLQFLAGSSAAEPGLIFSFYETPTRLRFKADSVCPELSTLFDSGVVEILWQTPTGDLLDAYGERLLSAVHRRKVKRLFIDGLTAFQNSDIEQSRIGNFFSAIANELRVLGVTTIYTAELPDVLSQGIRMPIGDAASIVENAILLRFAEVRARLCRLISVIKVRDSDFDLLVYQYALTSHGFAIQEASETAEAILADARDGTPPVSKRGG